MKKTARNLITTVMAAIMIFVLAFSVSAQGFDFEKALEEKSPKQTLNFVVGEEDEDLFKQEAQVLYADLFSSDENIIKVYSDGSVEATGKGTAYIAVVYGKDAYNLYKCVVKREGSSGTANTIGSNENNSSSSNSGSVDAFEYLDQVTSERYEKFENDVNNMYKEYNDLYNKTSKRVNKTINIMFVIGPIFFCVIFGTAIYIIVSMVSLSKSSMGKKHLPAQRETQNTVRVSATDRTHCPKCGKEYGEASFCSECGTSKSVKNQFVFPIDKRIPVQKFEEMINAWLAENPYIYDCKLKLDTQQSLFIPFVGHKFFIKSATVVYSVADKPQNHQYGFAFLYKLRLFGPIGYSTEKHVKQWKQNNPDCNVISSHGGRIQHWDSNGGIYAQYYNYVFFKK